MNTFNTITSAIFDVLLAPWGHALSGIDLVLWSVIAGLVALVVYKRVSNQKGIVRAKDKIKMHLLEIRLFRHDVRTVFAATGKVLANNFLYVTHNLAPMVVLLVPFMIILFQLEANFAFAPAEVGAVSLLHVRLDPTTKHRPTEIQLALPDGVVLDAPPVRTPDGEAIWRLRAERPGDHLLELRLGEATLTKGWAVGGEHRKVPVKKTRSWEALLYPGEGGIPQESPFYSAQIQYPERTYPLVGGEMGVLLIFFVLSLATGFAFKGLFGVTL